MKTFNCNPLVTKSFGSCLSAAALIALCTALPIQADPVLSATSLAGTTADGDLRTDDQGNLVVDSEVRRFIDYFLAARGELSDDALRGAAERAVMDRLPAPAAKQALELFDLYLRYLDEAPRVLGDGPAKALDDGSRIQKVYGQMTDLRSEIFGEDRALALFGADLGREAATLQLQSKLLSADETDALSAARQEWEVSLSADERQARSAALGPVALRERIETLRAAGAGSDDIWAARAQAYGPEAADRLARLDLERVEWQRRVETYRAQRATIERSKLAPAEKRRAVEGLLMESFNPLEQKRVRALDRIER